jgi:hypothetical protein
MFTVPIRSTLHVFSKSSRRAALFSTLCATLASACMTPAGDERAAGDSPAAPATDSVEQALGAPTLPSIVTGVGVSKGSLAVQFNGAWFRLMPEATQAWDVENHVTATAIGATPVDTSVRTEECICVPAGGGACTRQEQIEQCGTVIRYITDSTRTYNLTVGDSQYEVKALQTARTERHIAGGGLNLNLGFSADMRFEVRVITPGDPSLGDAQWVVKAQPKRHFIDCQFDEATLEQINISGEPASSSTPQDCEGTYSQEVQFSNALTISLPGAAEIKSPTNEALDEAMYQTFPQGLPYHNDSEHEAYNVNGNVLSRVDDETFGTIADLDRNARFFMKARDVSAYSDASGERGLFSTATPRVPSELSTNYTNTRKWTIKPLTRNITVRWPLLAGICGIEAFLRTSAGGSVTVSNQQCFNGIVQSTNVSGNIALEANAGAGGYCNIVVASASAGMQAGVKTAVEFTSTLETLPPAILASVNAYAQARFAAYFQLRILFWSRRWEKPFLARTVWQRGYTHRVFEQVSAPQLCNGLVDLEDMRLLNTPKYYLPGNPTLLPPPVKPNTTVQVQANLPGYANATTNLKVRVEGGPEIAPSAIIPGSPGAPAVIDFPSSSMNITAAGTKRVRLERQETVLGLPIRHVSNWIGVPVAP